MSSPLGSEPSLGASSATSSSSAEAVQKKGVLYALACYISWGFVPLYWKSLQNVSAPEILSHRIVWSMVFFVALIATRSRLGELWKVARNPVYLRTYMLTAILVGVNWLIYIYAVNSGHMLESSLGYFINPLVNVFLGMVFLREKLRSLQWVSVALATTGVVFLAVQADHFPFIALSLALTFGFYGLFRKKAPLDPVLGSSLESIMLMPLAACFLGFLMAQGEGAFFHASLATHGLLMLGGAVTALPLLWFAEAASRLPLSTLGFFQYLAPTFQFLLAVFLYNEAFTRVHAVAFGCIWVGLAVFILDSRIKIRGKNRAARIE